MKITAALYRKAVQHAKDREADALREWGYQPDSLRLASRWSFALKARMRMERRARQFLKEG